MNLMVEQRQRREKSYIQERIHESLTVNLPKFQSPSSSHLPKDNRWGQLASSIPWDEIVGVYECQLNNAKTGVSNINPCVVIVALMVKHQQNTSVCDTIIANKENIYIQDFLGFDTMFFEAHFSTSLFVAMRKRMGLGNIEKIYDLIYKFGT